MIVELSGYRIFIASPRGLENERAAFNNTVNEFNDAHAIEKEAIFLPVAWEEIPGGMGRAQDHINEQIQRCDYCVIVLHTKWGSPPGEDRKYESGTEEEFHVAVECRNDDQLPMRDVKIFFKAVDATLLNDPSAQLKKVLAFKKKIENSREHHYEIFDDPRKFEAKLRRHLARWLRDHEKHKAKAPLPVVAEPIHAPLVVAPAAPASATSDERETFEEAWHLATAGQKTDAETLFVSTIGQGGGAKACLEYGRFLRLDERLTQAEEMLVRALELTRGTGNEIQADAHLELGMVFYADERIAEAEVSFRKALELNVGLKREEAVADTKREFGKLLVFKGEFIQAEAMHREALAIDEQLGRRAGLAEDYSYLGTVLQSRQDFAGAETMHRAALDIDKSLERHEAVAKHYGDLGSLFLMQGEFVRAEEMYREALQLDEYLGRLDAQADDYSNLGILFERGDLDAAEKMHKEARNIDEGLERFEGVADHYENLAVIEESRGRHDLAAALRELAQDARDRATKR